MKGGLGNGDIDCMNVSILMKWKCIILSEQNAIWSNLLKHRYINMEVKIFVNDKIVITMRDSIRWA